TLLRFEEWAALAPVDRAGAVVERLAGLSPGWQATDLGRALVAASESIVDDEGTSAGAARVVVVSDLQQGARLDALRASEWPARIALHLEPVEVAGRNASLQALPDLGGE